MTTREHLKAFHEQAATHHSEMAEQHKKAAGLFSKAANDRDAAMCECHKGMQASHEACAVYHQSMTKSLDVEDLSKIVPDQVRAINTGFPGITAMPRTGAPTATKAPDVPFEFRDLVKISDD